MTVPDDTSVDKDMHQMSIEIANQEKAVGHVRHVSKVERRLHEPVHV